MSLIFAARPPLHRRRLTASTAATAVDAAGVGLPLSSRVPAEAAFPSADR